MKSFSTQIPFSKPYIGIEEKKEINKVLNRKWITTGPETRLFEELVKKYTNARCAVAVSSCTAALDISLAVHGVDHNSEIITTAYTFASTVMSVIHKGATPVLCDIEENSFNLDPDEILKIIEKYYIRDHQGLRSLKTGRYLKGIIPVHFAGQPVNLDRINFIAKNNNLFVIEDAAHAIGAQYRGKNIGDSNNLVCFSFYSNKNMTTAEGGMIVTNNTSLEEELRLFSLHGISKTALDRFHYKLPFYDIIRPGYKYNLSDLQAALGVAQIRKLSKITELRNQACEWYDYYLADVEEIQIPQIQKFNFSARHLYPILISKRLKSLRDDVIIGLRDHNIFPSVHFIPIHFHTYFSQNLDLDNLKLPVTEDNFFREISLPLFPELREEEVKYIAKTLKQIISTLQGRSNIIKKAI
jgi:dTDP-4-amino-4,6-dideoxygalactose transaminase